MCGYKQIELVFELSEPLLAGKGFTHTKAGDNYIRVVFRECGFFSRETRRSITSG